MCYNSSQNSRKHLCLPDYIIKDMIKDTDEQLDEERGLRSRASHIQKLLPPSQDVDVFTNPEVLQI